MTQYLADTYQDAYKLGERALKRGEGLTIDTNHGAITYCGPDLEEFMAQLAPGEPFAIVAIVPMLTDGNEPQSYAWTITRDHLATADETGDKWITGPCDVTNAQIAMLTAGAPLAEGYERHIFRMYDDDGELYYTGRAVFRADDVPTHDEAVSAPLLDYGAPAAGASRITWHGHPGWEVS